MARVDLRVSDAELAEWKAKAGERGLSAWIRERCNGNVQAAQAQPSALSEDSRRELVERIAYGLAKMDGVHPFVVMEKIKRLAALDPR